MLELLRYVLPLCTIFVFGYIFIFRSHLISRKINTPTIVLPKDGSLECLLGRYFKFAATVFAVSGGYPEQYEKGKKIDDFSESDTLFHAGTKRDNNGLFTNGGRVLAATSYGESMDEALKSSYITLTKVNFDKMVYRKDIGHDLKKYSNGSN